MVDVQMLKNLALVSYLALRDAIVSSDTSPHEGEALYRDWCALIAIVFDTNVKVAVD